MVIDTFCVEFKDVPKSGEKVDYLDPKKNQDTVVDFLFDYQKKRDKKCPKK